MHLLFIRGKHLKIFIAKSFKNLEGIIIYLVIIVQ